MTPHPDPGQSSDTPSAKRGRRSPCPPRSVNPSPYFIVPFPTGSRRRHPLSVYIFGIILMSHRVRLGLTQKRLSRRSGISPRTIQRIEHGDGWVLIPTARRLARSLKVTVDALLAPPTDLTGAADPRQPRLIAEQVLKQITNQRHDGLSPPAPPQPAPDDHNEMANDLAAVYQTWIAEHP